MTHDTILKVLDLICPNAKFNLQGETYEGLNWLDESQTKPTWNEIEAGAVILLNLSYQDRRRIKYPPIGDQLDALWKGGSAAADMKLLVDAVKTQFPKP